MRRRRFSVLSIVPMLAFVAFATFLNVRTAPGSAWYQGAQGFPLVWHTWSDHVSGTPDTTVGGYRVRMRGVNFTAEKFGHRYHYWPMVADVAFILATPLILGVFIERVFGARSHDNAA